MGFVERRTSPVPLGETTTWTSSIRAVGRANTCRTLVISTSHEGGESEQPTMEGQLAGLVVSEQLQASSGRKGAPQRRQDKTGELTVREEDLSKDLVVRKLNKYH
jgi:hypothetical protein